MARSRFEERFTEPAQLLKIMRYDKDVGGLFWLPRAPSDFHRNGEWTAPRWNGANAGKRCGAVGLNGYRVINHYGDFVYEHRAIWFLETGSWPEQVDHISGNREDNRFENLREVDPTDNNRNMAMQRRNTSGCTGVRWHQESPTYGRWKAIIVVNYKPILLYSGQDKQAAIAARLAGEEKYGFHRNHGRAANASSFGK